MDAAEVLQIVACGEDSHRQFKQDVTNAASLAAEMVALANSGGGQIFIGVTDGGAIHPHDPANVRRLNQLIANSASTSVQPPINPLTENVGIAAGVVIVVSIPDGLSKPYMDNNGAIWVKSGSDKRKVTAREEMQRMFQSAQLIHGDDVPVAGTSSADIDLYYFREFFKMRFDRDLDEINLSLDQVLSNMRLLSDGKLTVAGVLLFTKTDRLILPVCHVKAAWYQGNEITSSVYIDSQDISGRMETQFEKALGFLLRGLHRLQNGQSVNSTGQLEIPRMAVEELLANAFLHRDYFVSAPIRIFLFDDRLEIISPGHLPNDLTIANIRSGNSNIRNPILTSHATKILPYRGLGTGILRALKEYPSIEFLDDREGNLFRVTIKRRPLKLT